MNFRIILFALIISLFAISCSKDKKNNPIIPDDTKSYLPMKLGNYWLYDTYDLDMQNNPQTSTLKKDSLVIVGSPLFMNKEAYQFKQFTDGEERADYHFYNEEKKIYAESNYILPLNSDFNLPLNQITNQWVLLADFEGTNWDVLSHKFTNVPIQIGEIPGVTMTADYKTVATKGGNVNVQVAGTQVQATEITLRHTVSGSVRVAIITVPLNFTITQRLYFAQDYGLVKTFTESQTITLSIPGMGTQTIDVNGHTKNLTNYKIN